MSNHFFLNIYLFIILGFSSVNSSAYTPPLGIPDPDWGAIHPIDTQAPSTPQSWQKPSSAVSGHYYIDNTHPNATDSNNTYGHPDKPRRTIPETQFSAGSYVEIHGGPYTGGGQIIFTANGTEQKPVWVRGASKEDRPTIRGEMIVKGSYVFIENLRFDTTKRTLGFREHKSSKLHHAVVRHCAFEGPGEAAGNGSAISINGRSDYRFSDIVVYKNLIHDFGDDDYSAENDYHGIAPGKNVDRVWVLENTVYNMGGDSIQVGVANTADSNRVSHIYIGGNNFSNDRENAVDIKEADNVVISSNVMHGYRSTSSSAGGVVAIHNNPDKVWVINNTIYDGSYGVVTTGATDTWVIGNVIYDIVSSNPSNWNPASLYSDGSAIHFRGSTGGAINNTMSNFANGIQLATGSYKILNNLITDRKQRYGSDFSGGSKSIETSTIDHNLMYHGQGEIIRLGATEYTLKGFQDSKGMCGNCLKSQPLLDADLTSRAKTPSIDQGMDTSDIHKFKDLYDLQLNKDIRGNDRIQGRSVDIGSSEVFDSTSPPMVPKNVKITSN